MNFKQFLPDSLTIENVGTVHLEMVGDAGSFQQFAYYSQKNVKIAIGDEIDYLKLYTDIGSHALEQRGLDLDNFIILSDIGGKNLYFLEYAEPERLKFGDPYLYILSLLTAPENASINFRFSFVGEISLEKSSVQYFEMRARRILTTLRGDNQAVWQSIIDHKYHFLKIDIYVFSLQKLHSWAFHPVDETGKLIATRQYVVGRKPKPRGADRQRKSR